jgi:hypothetical protein
MSNSIKQGFRRLLVKHKIERTRSFEISNPTDFKHVYHVGSDQAFGNIDLVRFNFDNQKHNSEVKSSSVLNNNKPKIITKSIYTFLSLYFFKMFY